MRTTTRIATLAVLLFPLTLAAQVTPVYRVPKLPPPSGFRALIVPDMEGMGSTIMGSEVGATAGPGTVPDYAEHFRSLITQEVNAAITGARRGGARDFV